MFEHLANIKRASRRGRLHVHAQAPQDTLFRHLDFFVCEIARDADEFVEDQPPGVGERLRSAGPPDLEKTSESPHHGTGPDVVGQPLFLAKALEEPTRGAVAQSPVENHQCGDPRIGNCNGFEGESRMHLISTLSTEIEMCPTPAQWRQFGYGRDLAEGQARESACDLVR